ncbi:MAG: O-antigen ligase family protein, partial [Bradyrhizobium sp.]
MKLTGKMSRAQTQVEPGALDSTAWPARDVAAERTVLAIIRWSITVNVIASMGTASTALIPAAYTYLQQGTALSMWALLIYASAFVRPTLRLEFNPDLLAVVAFYGFAVISVLWTDRASATITKSAALAVTSFGAFCLITRIDVDDIVTSTIRGLSILAVASVCAAVFAPKIGVDQTWMHKGQWQGVFQSKQELGFLGAYLMFFSFYRKTIGQSWPIFLVTFFLGATCVIMSESRGAGALAVVACAVLFTSARSVRCMK